MLRGVQGVSVPAVELSALRDAELPALIEALPSLDLSAFDYVSVHAPSRFEELDERRVVDLLQPVAQRRWPIVVHPDVVSDSQLWEGFGSLVCIENMDKRKAAGRTADELSRVYEALPEASLCLDLAHARQVDPTMSEAIGILHQHGSRLKQIHLSDLNSASRHEALNRAALHAFRRVAPAIPPAVPVILETPATGSGLGLQIEQARQLFEPARVSVA